jgi:hypothetical protein
MCEGRGRPSLPPGRYFPMLLIGYFEGIDSERGLEWRCADSLSLREFLRLSEHEGVRRADAHAVRAVLVRDVGMEAEAGTMSVTRVDLARSVAALGGAEGR